jgi:hypothetical protein
VAHVAEPYWDFPGDTEKKHEKQVTTGLQVEILTQDLTKYKA